MDMFGDNHLRFENLVNYDKSKTITRPMEQMKGFENLVNYDKSKTGNDFIVFKSSLRTL